MTTMVLPAPVSPVTAVNPGPSGRVASAITPRLRIEISSITRRSVSSSAGPRHPLTGSANLRTSRSENGPGCSRASRTGTGERRTITRAPRGRSWVRRPSHHSTPVPWVRSSTSTANTDCGPTTSARPNRACGLSGTSSIASTAGQTIGPPAEKEYAVDPVGVDMTTPVAAEGGDRAAVDFDDDLEHPLPRGLLHGGLVERPGFVDHLGVHLDPHRQGHPLLDLVVAGQRAFHARGEVVPLAFGEEPDVSEVDPEQRRRGSAGQFRRAEDRAVAAEHDDQFDVVHPDLDAERGDRR